ncbi:DUF1450 domain-containing protein [Actinomycetes bacterium NPDC127524]
MKSLFSRILPKQKSLTLEFCQNNLDQFIQDDESFSAYKEILTKPGVHYKEYECLSNCLICRTQPYCRINGETITGQDPTDLLYKIKEIAKL